MWPWRNIKLEPLFQLCGFCFCELVPSKIRVRVKFESDNSDNVKIRTRNWCPISDFFELDNSDEGKFGSKSNLDNRNVKNLMSKFKIRMKFFYLYSFFRSDKFKYSNRINFCQHYWPLMHLKLIGIGEKENGEGGGQRGQHLHQRPVRAEVIN